MIEINLEKNKSEIKLLKPSRMLDNLPYGTVFRQWFEGEPSDTFFLTCGHSEKRVITFWWDNESLEYKVSTDNKKSLREYVPSVKVFKINAEIKINLAVKEEIERLREESQRLRGLLKEALESPRYSNYSNIWERIQKELSDE